MARAKWITLSPTQQTSLTDAIKIAGGYQLYGVHVPTAKSLGDQGLTDSSSRWANLTGFGVMVREAGIYARRERAAP
jgi:hypothetical protein